MATNGGTAHEPETVWQVIVVQARHLRGKGTEEPTHVQCAIAYGENRELTHTVHEAQPLWNYWTQFSDQPGVKQMEFVLYDKENDGSVELGRVVLDLAVFRKKKGKAQDMWKKLKKDGKLLKGEVHLTITFEEMHATTDDEMQKDCLDAARHCIIM
ncbi:unnamed protein product [Phaeothamnion confervicola]